MIDEWLASLDPKTQAKAQMLIERLEELGASDPENWVYSEITENIPQTARFLVLRRLWRAIDAWCDDTDWIQRHVSKAEQEPKGYFADAGLALKRMQEAGVDAKDIGRVARIVAFESIFEVLNIIDEGYDPDVQDEEMPSWALAEIDSEGGPTGRYLAGLHEDILSLDPSGREGCPE